MIHNPKKAQPRSVVAADGDLGALIRKSRLAGKMSQTDLGQVLGVSFQQVQKYENGTNRVSANRLAEIAKALSIRTEDFYKTEDNSAVASSIIDIEGKDTLRMLRAYSRIKDQATQRQIVIMIEAIAAADDV